MNREDLNQIRAIVKEEIAKAADQTQEFAREIETRLLTAFHGHAKGQTAPFTPPK